MTEYKLAKSPSDYQKANVFLRGQEVEKTKLRYPTILATRDEKVIGVLGTLHSDDKIVVGPMSIEVEGNPAFVLIKLIDHYERILKAAGVVVYNFFVDEKEARWLNSIERLKEDFKTTKAGEIDGLVWFRRHLQ